MGDYNYGLGAPPHRRWPVAWYNPAVLLRSAREMVSTADQNRNLDRRELYSGDFAAFDATSLAEDDAFWWDFVSDTGDGGNATYTVAKAVLAPEMPLPGADALRLPAGRLLVLGGDMAYPGAGTEEYQYRFNEMWEAARPAQDEARRTVLAIPQNHDWFDNISSFQRHFVDDHDDGFLNAHTPQSRSYFVARLPHGWWLFGLDFALLGDLDREQYEVLRDLVRTQVQPGQNVILLYPEPYWTRPLGDAARPGYAKRYQRLEALLLAQGARVRMRLAGDLHHYVRETAARGEGGLDFDDALITCGSGGAFLHPTHARKTSQAKRMCLEVDEQAMTDDLRQRVRVGTVDTPDTAELRGYQAQCSYPDPAQSRCLSWRNWRALFQSAGGLHWSELLESPAALWQNIVQGNMLFPLLLGVLYWAAVYCNAFVFSHSFHADGFLPPAAFARLDYGSFLALWVKALFFSPLAFAVHALLLVLCCAIAREDGPRVGVLTGVPHALLHMFWAASLYWLLSRYGQFHLLASSVAAPRYPWADVASMGAALCHYLLPVLAGLLKGAMLIVLGAAIGGLTFGCYFALMARCGYLGNNAFSPLAWQGYKGFLRFCIDAQGNLHGYMLGTDQVPQRWQANPDAAAKRPIWVEAAGQKAPEWRVCDQFTLRR
ncbi:hypothetical protein GCM10007907_19520 [Chitinimonas prasina]|uniref:Metallophosphoesterase n=1 Tax=Chitinimonas prasina TaxID=1434937 RepID=A0ABQ5YF99_9NEIS|nr:metallophosphoesterase [Chitinimonas prasina]GLR13162.1 hypothetical protein GCM10007907_19520 [Chitinimonas prasina]